MKKKESFCPDKFLSTSVVLEHMFFLWICLVKYKGKKYHKVITSLVQENSGVKCCFDTSLSSYQVRILILIWHFGFL